MSFKRRILRFINKKDPEDEIRENIKVIHQLVQERLEEFRETYQDEEEQSSSQNTDKVKKEFYLDALAVANQDGEIIQADVKEEFNEILKEKKLPQKITEQFPNTKLFTLRNNGQNNLIYREEDKFYLMKTPGTISMPEIKRITQKLEKTSNYPKTK